MNIPGFAAEASLYKTSRHYRSSGHSISLPPQMSGAINAVVMAAPIQCQAGEEPVWDADGQQWMCSEIINVYGCPPGSIQQGDGASTTCTPVGDSGDGNRGGHQGNTGGGNTGQKGGSGQPKDDCSPPKGFCREGRCSVEGRL